MDGQFLIVVGDRARAQQIADFLDFESAGAGDVVSSRRFAEVTAISRLKYAYEQNKAFNACIVDLELPAQPDAVAVAGEHRGLNVMRVARRLGAAVVILADCADEAVNAAIRNTDHAHICRNSGHDWLEDLQQSLEELLKGAAPRRKPAYITVSLGRDSRYEIRAATFGGLYDKNGTIELRPNDRDDIIAEVKALEADPQPDEYEAWEERLARLGRRLYEILCEKNADFGRHLEGAIQSVGGLENVRFTVRLDQDVYPILVEALQKPEEKQFWMLYAPFMRRLSDSAGQSIYPLSSYGNRTVVEILVIQSDVEGSIVLRGDQKFYLSPLPSLHEECEYLLSLQGQGVDPATEIRVTLLKNEPGAEPLSRRLMNELRRKRWNVVHFAGHSWGDRIGGTAYLFFPTPDLARPIEPIAIADLAESLRGCQLAYLSSCQSSSDPVVYALANAQVPAIIGFRWKINDAVATEHTKLFYQALLRNYLVIDKAFMETRQLLRQSYLLNKNRGWAAATLVVQAAQDWMVGT